VLLIVTQRGDLTADWLIRELEERDADFVRFNTEDYPSSVSVVWRPAEAALRIGGRDLLLDEVTAVWYRRPASPRLPDTDDPEAATWAARESAEALIGVWRTLDALWVNHPDSNRLAESKLEQLQAAEALGFDTPATLVTNDGEALAAFVESHAAAGVVCKPLWRGRLVRGGREQLFFTSRLDPSTVRANDVGPEPYLFQEHVPKLYDIRVTVIGRDAFAARIESQGTTDTETDWRRGTPGALRHEAESLPADLADRCVALCVNYGLQFGAIDLARRPDGGHTFFEINPNGQWAWVEQRTGLPLRAALADLLLTAIPA
jgi:glutathione synthase/RimK-type ligase-like ATP-grasp enzyme